MTGMVTMNPGGGGVLTFVAEKGEGLVILVSKEGGYVTFCGRVQVFPPLM